MIIGSGLLAKALQRIDSQQQIFFCSGVSNSSETDNEEFKREEKLFKETSKNRKIIYFSTLDVLNDDKRKYVEHKRMMEKMVIETNNYLIFRLPQVIGAGGNKNNLVNYFAEKIKNKEIIKIRNVKRSVLDVQDVVNFVDSNKSINNEILELFGEELDAYDILFMVFNIMKSKYQIGELNVQFDDLPDYTGYTYNTLRKYL